MKGDQSILRGRAKGASAGLGMFLMLSVYHVPTALSMRRAYLSNPLPNRYVTALLLQQVPDLTKYAPNDLRVIPAFRPYKCEYLYILYNLELGRGKKIPASAAPAVFYNSVFSASNFSQSIRFIKERRTPLIRSAGAELMYIYGETRKKSSQTN